jgi:hypothetical protein
VSGVRCGKVFWYVPFTARLIRIEGTGLESENCKPLWDKVVGEGMGTKKGWIGGGH